MGIRKPSERQRRVARKLIDNSILDKPLTGGEIVEASGYGVSMSKNPQVILESDGVKDALEEYGFSVDNADKVVAKILHEGKDENKLKASDQIYKRLGGYAPEKNVNVNLEISTAPEIKELTEKLNELYRDASIGGDGGQSGSLGNKA